MIFLKVSQLLGVLLLARSLQQKLRWIPFGNERIGIRIRVIDLEMLRRLRTTFFTRRIEPVKMHVA